MKLLEVKLSNFRSYHQETSVSFEDLTVLIGKNDAGKSSILDALDIYFNNANIGSDDCCVHDSSTDIRIKCVFDTLPKKIIIDAQRETSLQDEYLLRSDGFLEIGRTFKCSSDKGKSGTIFARALHPTSDKVNDLLALKNTDLKKRAESLGVPLDGVNKSVNAELRQAIWKHCEDLRLVETDVDLTKETGKEIWDYLEKHLPLFALFKSDRASTDQDSEAQDPMKAAVKEVIRRRETELATLVDAIQKELEQVATRTIDKIREMSPELAGQLNPAVSYGKWDSLFKISLTGDDNIPINKRGSGTRRLILLNFFRAKAEEDAGQRDLNVIYAIEEPETSQHPNNQKMLLEAFEDLVNANQCQVILTTHTPTLVRKVSGRRLRLITQSNGSSQILSGSHEPVLDAIKTTLGVLPDHDIRAFLGLEGRNDIEFMRRISRILHGSDASIPDLEAAEKKGQLVFIPLSGSSLDLWVERLAGLERPEFYLTDRDTVPPAEAMYQMHVDKWNQRANCTAWVTNKRTLENYLHPDAIKSLFPKYSGNGDSMEDVPCLLAEIVHASSESNYTWAEVLSDSDKLGKKLSNAKRRLNKECVEAMTLELLSQIDPKDELKSWLRSVGEAL